MVLSETDAAFEGLGAFAVGGTPWPALWVSWRLGL